MKQFLLFGFLLVFLPFTGECQPSGQERAPVQNSAFEQEVLDLVNQIRKKHHLQALLWEENLAWAARYHAKDMADDDYVEHYSYDRKGKRLVKVCGTFERIEQFADFPYLAENISAGKPTAKETVDGWMHSKGHRENILNPNYKYLGVGYYYTDKTSYRYYWVQDFGG